MAGSFRHQVPAARPGEPRPERIVGPEDPHFVPLSGISTWLQTAVVTTEDAGFWGHRGFEPTELKEAVLENLRSGEGRGGSTITQQLAKNLFLSGARTASRKLQEALVASRLEEELPKSRLLELYLNIAEWGPGLYGARDAAEHYLGRSPSTLQPEEAAFLASLLPSPVRFHGYYHRGGLTENRRERVTEILATMLALGRMTPDEHVRATAAPLELALCPW
jgi:membrane peptidoglycan carboxypeptidase